MARFPITENECNQILSLPKIITEDVSWTQKANKSWGTTRLTVENDLRAKLELRITVNNEEPSKFSLVLLLNGIYRVRGLCISGSHANKCTDNKRWNCQIHKHSWNDTCPGGHAYTPTDITGITLNDVFLQFCSECNIDFQGNFKPLPIQKLLTGV